MANVTTPLRWVNRILSPGGRRARLTVMIFHRVLPERDPLLVGDPDASHFESLMLRVREWFNVLSLEEAVLMLRTNSLPPRALSITFDDGYADNYSVAFPILQRLQLHATFFIATGYLDGGCMWNDEIIETVRTYEGDVLDLRALDLGRLPTHSLCARRDAIEQLIEQLKYEPTARRPLLTAQLRAIANVERPADLMMKSDDVRSLSVHGMGIGAHTHSHPILSQLEDAEAEDEIAGSKRVLEQLIGRPVRLFAYPNGKPGKDYTSVHVQQVRDLGFIGACSTSPGCATARSDPFQLPRFTPWDRESWKFGARLSRNLFNPLVDAA